MLDEYRGGRRFGPAYAYMFSHDVHGEGSLDRALIENMILLCAKTAPILYRPPEPARADYRSGARPGLEAALAGMRRGADADPAVVVRAVAAGCADMVRRVDAANIPLDEMRFGGTEEEIAARGSNWCTDVARLACRLCQVAGLPARIVILADAGAAYSGHQIIEVWYGDAWGAVDPTLGVAYTHAGGRPASTWDLKRQPDLVRRHRRGAASPYTRPEQFRAAAISDYPLDAAGDYRVVRINPYCRSILEMADRGWPGGLRWLHGEDHYGGSAGPEGRS